MNSVSARALPSASSIVGTALALSVTTLALVPQAAAQASAPVLFYSDIVSGPATGGEANKGAVVTVWGRHFGATQGTSLVTVGGGAVDNYRVWSDSRITFQLGAAAA